MKLSSSTPSPPCNVVLLFKLPVENNKPPNFTWRGGGGVWIVVFSEVTPRTAMLLPTVAKTDFFEPWFCKSL